LRVSFHSCAFQVTGTIVRVGFQPSKRLRQIEAMGRK